MQHAIISIRNAPAADCQARKAVTVVWDFRDYIDWYWKVIREPLVPSWAAVSLVAAVLVGFAAIFLHYWIVKERDCLVRGMNLH